MKPAWPDPVSLKHLTFQARTEYVFTFQNRVHDFILCQRRSLEKRASALPPSKVGQIILQDRAAEERALAEVERIDSCLSLPRRESDPGVIRKKCEEFVDWALEDRRPPETPYYTELKSEQRSLYGGVWSFRTLDFGRPGSCNHVECDKVLGVEVTNLTPVALRCEVALAVSNPQDGMRRGEAVITLSPGDSLPAAQVRISRAPADIEPEVQCSRATPLAADSRIPAACALNWMPRTFRFSESRMNYSWNSGTALVEFSAGQRYQPPAAIHIVGADSPDIGQRARSLIEKLPFSTNCAAQRFRVRVEYRAFPCHACLSAAGVVTLLRDERGLR